MEPCSTPVHSRTTPSASTRTATRSSRTRSSPSCVDELADRRCATSRRSSTSSRPGNSFEGAQTLRVYNLLALGPGLGARARAPERAAARRGRARPGLPHLVAELDHDPARRDRAADPRRRPAAPDPEAARPDRLQLDVGAHRLHRGERRDPPRPGLPPLRPLPRLRHAVRLDRGRDAEGQRAHLARQPVARRRREHHRHRPRSASR